jgi:hypothetical protein
MKTFYTNTLPNNHVNQYVDANGHMISDLISYTTKVASYNHQTNEMQVFGWFSQTTAKHINSFLSYYGFCECNKKTTSKLRTMTQIQVTENAPGKETYHFVVGDKQAELIERVYRYKGGFMRFNFEIYDDGIHGRKNQFNDFKKWFNKITGSEI